ncbi:neutral/alkaline ceramidase [Streptomyces zagrosensis]|uniref:Neutral ceramidase n=1 Tax=Streptomyces zagrosensis TaxID=1042984 RepID=A0A7W9Q757_9ACTN|nr:neutral/alkaline ceramidase [Streptomyces zagrosensis]MBB5934614.1 neutral ceramidase [Streptomyces zagrosensis]
MRSRRHSRAIARNATVRAVIGGLVAALVAATGLAAVGPAAADAARTERGQATQQQAAADRGYRVGVGIADITGEAAEVGMMGYARLDQQTSGIHTRQWARAFVVEQPGGQRAVFVSADAGMIMQGVHQEVLRRLAERFGPRYTESNVTLSATHTHAGPGGHSHHVLYNLTTLGYQKKTYEAIVSGIVASIVSADAHSAPGTVKIATGDLHDANVNRSAEAFRRNPAAERARFPGEVDTRMTVLRFEHGGRPIGMLSWFPTHATSMTPENTLISADNKGYAAYRVEHDAYGVDADERGRFVAAFAQTNAGDMSPNLRDGGAHGPTDDEFENTKIIGKRQADKALELFNGATEELRGPIDHRQRYVDFSAVDVAGGYTPDGQPHRTCQAALGQAFTAGAEDGPGPDLVEEGDLRANPLVVGLGAVLNPAPAELRRCQAPKPVFLATGAQHPSWTPQILPVQIVRIGQLTLTAAPAEFTIAAGHRVTDTVAAELGAGSARHTVFAGYSNAYSQYVTTPQEYDAQHYEGASTHFGRYTLPAYQQEFAKLARALRDGEATPSTVRPPWQGDRQLGFQPGVVLDTPPAGKAFGDVRDQPADSYRRGERATATFYTGHPKNDLHTEGTFLEVQRRDAAADAGWRTVATDNDWSTVYRWKRAYLAVSTAQLSWDIPKDAASGEYRITHHGDARSLGGDISPFTGTSRTFTVH